MSVELPKKFICMGYKVTLEEVAPIHNKNSFVKPFGGLWVSPYIKEGKYLSAWHRWCEGESFIDYKDKPCSLITLKSNAKVYVINNHNDAYQLWKNFEGIDPFKELEFSMFKSIDFEGIAKEYDALFLTTEGEFDTRHRMKKDEVSLYGWDCESMLILNKNCIENIDHVEYNNLIEARNGMEEKKTIVVNHISELDLSELLMPLVVVYEKPLDYPDFYVGRVFDIDKPTNCIILAYTYEELISKIPNYMHKLPREKNDPKSIIESWV